MLKVLIETWTTLDNKEKVYLKSGLGLILILGFISIVILPWLLTREIFSIVNYSQTGGIGDTINGIAGPFIALIASILTFLAFYIQYKANQQQKIQYLESLKNEKEERKAQEEIWKTERIENKFYELIRLHKSNVVEMNIADIFFGRKCFIHMFYELRSCFLIVEEVYNMTSTDKKEELNYAEIDLLDFAYTIFFYGIGPQSEKQYQDKLEKNEFWLFQDVKKALVRIQNHYEEHIQNQPLSKYYTYFFVYDNIQISSHVEYYYFPFDGHASRLGHYYRHLFQTASFIIKQNFLTFEEKYEYLKTLRAQLSNFEQLLLYYNAIAWFDSDWRIILTKYRLIKNMPLALADFNSSPIRHFENEIIKLKEKGIDVFDS